VCFCSILLQIGLAALERAMRAPTRVIVENAGEEGSVIVGKLLENDADSSIGYNAAAGVAASCPRSPLVLI
jgi:chaperonin GroEL (HSP60 family)